MLVQNGQVRFIHFLFLVFFWQPKCRRMQGTASVNLHLRLFPAVMSSLSSNRLAMLLPNRAWQTRPFEDMCRRQESGAFPLSVAPPFELPRGALHHPLCFPFSFPPLQQVCRYSHAAIPDGISGHFRCRGKGKDGIRNTNFLATISTLRRLR